MEIHSNKKFLRVGAIGLLWAILANFGPCSTKTRDRELRLQRYRYSIGLPSGGNPWAKEQLLKIIASAQREILAAFADLHDAEVTEALINKAQRGLAVAIAGDQRNENKNPGFAQLKALRSQDMFLDQRSAFQKALQYDGNTLAGKSARDRILRTRLNFNRQNRSRKYNAAPYDGRVEYNLLVADRTECWAMTGGVNPDNFVGGSYSVAFHFSSFDICNDMANEIHQLAWGGVFGDEGVPNFGLFRHNKAQVDPNTHFTIDHLRFHFWYAPQEKPIVATLTELMRAERRILFVARALTQDMIQDISAPHLNRSHILNILEYHVRKPQIYGVPFSLKGVFGNEVGLPDTNVGSPWAPMDLNYNALMNASCPTINTQTVTYPYIDANGNAQTQSHANRSSIHCALKTLRDSINGTDQQSGTIAIRKYPQPLPFNLFVIDHDFRHPRVILMFSDLRKRYYYDNDNSQDSEPRRTRNDFFPITDSLVMMVEPIASESPRGFFRDFATLAEFIYQVAGSGGDVW
ncbi:MAG: hypothetical protein NZM25_10845 [Leptospiraceae bacterium]|nr:hypothetical protein [Leptospiraceae bacterium]MDW8305926.1 hypothetical protein [Leptospiraceae bacterium]